VSEATFRLRWRKISRRIRVPLGFLFVIVYFCLARPSFQSLLTSLILVVPGILLRGYASGYVKKNTELTITGPYGYTRNPLYLGSILIAFGFALAARSIWVAVALALLFLVIYGPVILDEEEFLRAEFPGYAEYALRVPRLVPRPWALQSGEKGKFSFELYLKHREYNSLLGSLCMYLVLAARMLLWR
jgi:protein-S-isoprenylcysteine O-methyltransferase Ste14